MSGSVPSTSAPGLEPGAGIEAASASEAAQSADLTGAPEGAAPPTRRRRKAAAPAARRAVAGDDAAGAGAAPPAESTAEVRGPAAEVSGVAETVAGAGEAAAPVKATRSRRKKAAPALSAPSPAEPTQLPPAAGPAGPDTVAGTGTGVPETAGSAVPAASGASVETRTGSDVPETAGSSASGGVAETEAVVADIPVTRGPGDEQRPPRGRKTAARPAAVLFMSPDEAEPAPTTRRRRRGAAAAPPEPEPTPAEAAGTTSAAAAEPAAETTPAARATGTGPAAGAAETGPAEPAEGSRRGRRRRRGAAEAPADTETSQTESAETTTEVAEPALDEPDDTADDVEDDEDLDEDETSGGRRRRRRGRRGRGRGKGPADEIGESGEAETEAETDAEAADEDAEEGEGDGVTRRRRRRRRKGAADTDTGGVEDGVHTVVRVREPRRTDEVQGVSGSTRLEAKRQRRRDGREQRRTRPPILSESEFLARREAVDRVMVVRQKPDRTQIAVLEDGILVEHYVARATSGTMVGNVYLGKVQNVLPSMEAAFVDVGRGRNAVLYAGEVNWDATGLEGRARSIEQAMRSGDSVLVQVTKDPIGHKGARLTSHIALSGRHLVYVPNGNASGISRKLPDTERKRLRDILKKMVPDGAGVIVRTAAEGASEDELARDVKRLQSQWEDIRAKAAAGHAPVALSEEPDLVIRVVRDLFNEDFRELIVQGDQAYTEVENYLNSVSPDLVERLHRHTGTADVFAERRIDEQILKGLDRKVFLPSGGHLVIDRTEAMTVVDVNTGKYTGAGGNLEETVTRNNLEAAEEIVRQLRLRDLGGIVVIDFIDMVLESNRELVLRRLTECLGRDRTKHQVTEITSLGLVQMTRKRIGAGLLEAFSEVCDHCKGRGVIIHPEPVPEKRSNGAVSQVKAVAAATRAESAPASGRSRRRRGGEIAAEIAVPEATGVEDIAGPLAAATEAPVVGSGIVTPGTPRLTESDGDDDYDISGYDLSRYEAENLSLYEAEEAENLSRYEGREARNLSRYEADEAANLSRYEAEEAENLSRYEAEEAENLSRYEAEEGADNEPLRLVGADDPDNAEDDDAVSAGAGRRRSRRGGTRRRTRP